MAGQQRHRGSKNGSVLRLDLRQKMATMARRRQWHTKGLEIRPRHTTDESVGSLPVGNGGDDRVKWPCMAFGDSDWVKRATLDLWRRRPLRLSWRPMAPTR